MINGEIANAWAAVLLIAAVAAWLMYSVRRFGMVYRHEHLRDKGKSLLIGPRAIFDANIWTPEGRAFQRAYYRVALRFWASLAALYLILDWLW